MKNKFYIGYCVFKGAVKASLQKSLNSINIL